MEQRPYTDVASQWSAPPPAPAAWAPWPEQPSAAWGPPPDPWAPPPLDPWTPPAGSPQQPTQPLGWQAEPAPPVWAPPPVPYGPQPPGPGRAQARRGPSGPLIAGVIAAVLVLLAGLGGAGVLFVRHQRADSAQARQDKGHGPAATAPATPTTVAPPAPEAAAPSAGASITTADFSFERPAGWHDASGAASSPGAVQLDSGERVDCALMGPADRAGGTGILVSSVGVAKGADASRADADALGAVAVATLKANPEVVKVGSPVVIDLDGVAAARVGFQSELHGDRVAGTELLTVHGGRLWRVLLVGAVADASANRADLETVVGGWRWR